MCKHEWIALLLLGLLLGAYTNSDTTQIPIFAINVTTNGTAWSNWTEDKVNDGVAHNRSIHSKADDCNCCTALYRPSWVQLRLDKIYLVERVLVLGREDIVVGQFDDIVVSWGLREESLQTELLTYHTPTFASKMLIPPREIQFVRVTGSDTIYVMTICEIILYRQAECPLGSYSVNCSKQCHCRVGPCDSVSGACGNWVCAEGWKGKACNETCNPGVFGANCSSMCNCYDNATCHHIDGTCPNNQRAAGWTRDNCSVACDQGMFGINCSSQCHCLHGATCDFVTGHCPYNQCASGWIQSNCSEACKPGYYGQSCCMDCHCDSCHHINGSCAMSLQCYDGYRMENGFCKPEVCNSTTERQESHSDKYYNALLAVSSVLGIVVAAIIVFIVVYSRTHRRSAGGTRANKETSSNEMYDDLSTKSTNPSHYDCLQTPTIGQTGRL